MPDAGAATVNTGGTRSSISSAVGKVKGFKAVGWSGASRRLALFTEV